MKFSIVTPVLNMVGTIRDCIESVVRQAGDVEAIQHIVVDGGSDDGTLEIISEYPCIELVHEPTPGIYVAMNRGIAAARHEVVGLVNADDRLEAGALRAVAEALVANPQVDVVAGRAVVERGEEAGRKVDRIVPRRGHAKQSWDLMFHGSMPTNAYYFRRRVFDAHGTFHTGFAICADRELLVRLKLAGVPTLPVRRILYRYLAHEGSTTLNIGRRHDVRMCEERIAIAQSFLAGGGLSAAMARRFHGWVAGERARIMIAGLKAGDWRAVRWEAGKGMAESPGGFLTFVARRSLAAPTTDLRRLIALYRF